MAQPAATHHGASMPVSRSATSVGVHGAQRRSASSALMVRPFGGRLSDIGIHWRLDPGTNPTERQIRGDQASATL